MRPHVPVLPTRVASVAKAYRRLSRRREVAHATRCCVTNKIGANVAPSDTVGIPQPTPPRDRPRAGLGFFAPGETLRSYRVLTADRAAEIVAAIRGMPWEPGRSAREHGKVKRTMELRADKCPEAKPYLDEIAQAIGKCGVFEREHIEAAHYPRFSLYAGGGEYRIHTDAAYMGRTRTDVALTLFLTDDFEGGELCIDGVLPGG